MPKAKFQPEYFLLSLIIFTLPFNWFLKWDTDSAFLRGIKIDYLLPKIYLQDILLFCLAIYLLYSYKHRLAFHLKQKISRLKIARIRHSKARTFSARLTNLTHCLANNLTPILFMSLVLIVGLRTIATQQASSYAGFLQLVSATAFAYYLYKRFSFERLLKLARPPLVAAGIMQSTIGIYQYIFHKSLVGYILFGEIDLSLPGAIARESFFGALRTLPYGTLPHPNILAGFLGVTCIVAWLEIQLVRQRNKYLILKYLLLGLFLITALLTRSWVAVSGILLLFSSAYLTSRYRMSLLFCLYSIITITYHLLPKWSDYQSMIETGNQSIIRRVKLNQAGFSVLHDHFWLGTGLNQSLKPMHTTYSMLTPADFIQPIHSIYLLWLVETGVIGGTLTGLVVLSLSKRTLNRHLIVDSTRSTSSAMNGSLWLIPLLFTAWLGIFDHYILTIRQGQLLTALAIALALTSVIKVNKIVIR